MRWRDTRNDAVDVPHEADAEPGSSLMVSITRFWVTLVVVGLIAYGTLLVVSRQAGFRDLVSNRLEELLGFPVEIERASLDPTLRLNLIGFREATKDAPRFSAGEVRVKFRLGALWRKKPWPIAALSVRDGLVRFTRDAAGGWSPFPEVAGLLLPLLPGSEGLSGAVDITEWMRTSRTRFDLQGVTIVWYGEHPEMPEGVVQGLSMRAVQVRPFDDVVLWVMVRIDHAELGGEPWLQDYEREWLRRPDSGVGLPAL